MLKQVAHIDITVLSDLITITWHSLHATCLTMDMSAAVFFVFKAESLGPDEIFIGSLLLRHLQLLQFNAHEIFETCVEALNKFQGSKIVYVGAGIYPTVAMFNHDCHPALAR